MRRFLPAMCLVLSLLFQTASYGFGKQASLTIGAFSFWTVATNLPYLLSLLCLGLQAVAWQIALRKYPLSFAYFFMSILFINILLLGRFVFHETITRGNAAGSLLIIAGVILLTRGQAGVQSGGAGA
ncbi:MAG: hypothetical protein HYV26_22240 [Candidatus Hydrogenedentes bacterium]|nr:hypothetical protein [Candidatus Hydrogenedentota bacterium]